MPCKDCGNKETTYEGTMVVSTCNVTVCGRHYETIKAERDRYKADWEKLMAAIGPYSTVDIAAKMARGCLTREGRYKAALEAILERHGVSCPPEGCGHPRCDFCIARKALKA